jgi:hypothetical protein
LIANWARCADAHAHIRAQLHAETDPDPKGIAETTTTEFE